MSTDHILVLRGFGVAFGEQVVLASVSLEVPRRGVVSLVGSAGVGKSTLVRTLAGLNDAQPALQTWGEAAFDGEPLGAARPALVHQHARLLAATVRENLVSALRDRSELTKPEQTERVVATLRELDVEWVESRLAESVVALSLAEQRAIAIVRAVLTSSPLVLVDEPTSGLTEDESEMVRGLLAQLARRRGLLLVTHDRRLPRRIGGRIAFLAGGRIVENRRAASFFDRPMSPPAQAFVRTGRDSMPGPMAKPEHLRPSQPPPPPLPEEARAAVSRSVGPRGFHWLLPGALGGLPRPGIVRELEQDLEGLRRLGVTRLVTLEEERTIPEAALGHHGIAAWHFPIDDMQAPELEAAASLCAGVEAWIRDGEVVAMHCRAGLGRTGTQLASQLVWRGASALEALECARCIHPRWVQSEEQVSFLSELERWLRARRSGGPAAEPPP